ncbi:F0F1 ATP synthase subunit gamma [Acidipila sp. EB88]|uniref:F0F1 ATP synthase subunit gamma n=1 Tax=Acidipila sp. EB88 TaxID=2305226 RepID=UPI000F5D6D3D|nr:FoF1 ATP synthase subunit gamma [Acidipila sp. EB88]RRA48575.1 F0F1 ATP synthase subunit gamma [Acidipila sp. EB88]
MANVLDLRRRIRSVKNTRQITKAMKMVAAAKLRRAQERMTNARPYAVALASVLASMRRRVEAVDPSTSELRSPLLERREEKNILLVIVSGDKGFAGAFSTNIIRTATQFIRDTQQSDRNKRIDLEALGRKGRDFFRRNYATAQFSAVQQDTEAAREGFVDTHAAPRPNRNRREDVEFLANDDAAKIVLDRLRFEDVRVVAEDIVERYAAAEIDAVYLAYNEFKSVLSQRVVVERILPLISDKEGSLEAPDVKASAEPSDEERQRMAEAAASAGLALRDEEQEAVRAQYEDESKRFGTAEVDYLYDQPAADVYASVLPRYVSALLYYASLESIASEHAARMTAMDAATSNASDMIDSLTLTMNRARQAAITKEIIEIVSGAAAV